MFTHSAISAVSGMCLALFAED